MGRGALSISKQFEMVPTVLVAIVLKLVSCEVSEDAFPDFNFFKPNNGASQQGTRDVPGRECTRPCSDQSLTCLFDFVLENYATLTDACGNCSTTSPEDCDLPQCIPADGYETAVKSVNRMLPGPAIQVCRGDVIKVTVHNRLLGEGSVIHWHGILQRGTPHMDGVEMVTQCSIPSSTSFRYTFKAEDSGTYFWHSHTEFQRLDGIDGALIIREPRNSDALSSFYDYDLPEHYVFLQDWLHELGVNDYPGRRFRDVSQLARNILINGRGRYLDPTTGSSTSTPYHVFHVEPAKRYRFRVINGASLSCPLQMQVQGHRMLIVATDAGPLKPLYVDTLVSFSGERYDFVLETRDEPGAFWIQVKVIAECGVENFPNQLAILMYKGARLGDLSGPLGYNDTLPRGVLLNVMDRDCDSPDRDGSSLCIADLRFGGNSSKELLKAKVDLQIYMPFGFSTLQEELRSPDKFFPYIKPNVQFPPSVSFMGRNLSFSAPSSPLLTQRGDVGAEALCNQSSVPGRCRGQDLCYCTHLQTIPFGALVEVVLVDTLQGVNLSHPFHLHGYRFAVLSQGRKTDGRISVEEARRMDAAGLLRRRLEAPPLKDTVLVQSNGYTVIRFKADNPGYWLFHCHLLYHSHSGMQIVFQVEGKVPPAPTNFPKCGNFPS